MISKEIFSFKKKKLVVGIYMNIYVASTTLKLLPKNDKMHQITKLKNIIYLITKKKKYCNLIIILKVVIFLAINQF